MKRTMAIGLYKSLNKKELKRFRKYLCSPFNTEQEVLLELFLFLKNLPEEKIQVNKLLISTLELYDSLYQGDNKTQQQKIKKVYNILSDFGLALEHFIAIESLRSDQLKKSEYVVSFLSSKKDNNSLASSFNKYRRAISREKDTETRYHYYRNYYQMKFESVDVNTLKKKESTELLNGEYEMVELQWRLNQLRYYCHLSYRKNIIIDDLKDQEEKFNKVLIENKSIAQQGEHAAISIYWHLIKLIKEDPCIASFNKTFGLLEDNIHRLSYKEQNTFCRYLLNYCIRSVNRGKSEFHQEKFKLENWGLENGILLNEGVLSDEQFINIALTGIMMGKFEYVESFIIKYQNKLLPTKRLMAVYLVRAYVSFFLKDEVRALGYIREIEATSFQYKLRVQSLKIRIVYLLWLQKEYDLKSMKTVIQSYKRLFSRNTFNLGHDKQKNYHQLAVVIEKLIKIQQLSGEEKLKKIESLQRLIREEPPECLSWIKNQVALIK